MKQNWRMVKDDPDRPEAKSKRFFLLFHDVWHLSFGHGDM
jgi:hypothetical protein